MAATETTGPPRALIAGVTGIQGGALADRLTAGGWEVYGLARQPAASDSAVRPIAADLTDLDSLRGALDGIEPTHVFFTAWARPSH